MPRLMATKDDQVISIPGAGNFQFSAVRIEKLGASEYTLVTIACDISGSVYNFANELLKCIKSIIEACKKSPLSENLLVRLILFNDKITEVHGFKKLSDIDPNAYQDLHPDDYTALFDASYDAIGSTVEYAKMLIAQDFDCNGCVYIITDGMNNRGKMTPRSIREKLEDTTVGEKMSSLITVLIGLQDQNSSWSSEVKKHLEDFKEQAKLTEFIDIGAATPQKLAKLASFVSQSVSSQSQSLVNGTPSQSLQF